MFLMTQQAQLDQGKRALQEFQKLIQAVYLPLLRAVTGNPKLQVKPTSTVSATDGKTVFLMVPWALGETHEHDSSLCNKRDPQTLKMLCGACAIRDDIDSTVFHESAHITSKSFEPVDPTLIEKMVREHCPFIDMPAGKLPWQYKGRQVFVQVLASFIEPVYLPQIANIVEDIYVNRRLFQHRAGVEASMQASFIEVFSKGFKQGNGNHISWDQQPLDAQAVMVAYILGHHLPDLIRYLDPRVQPVADDKVVEELMEMIPPEGDPYIRMEISLRLLARLRELGFCIPPSQKDKDDDDDDDKNDDDDKDDDDDDGKDESTTVGEPCTNGDPSDNKDEDAGDDTDDDDDDEDGDDDDTDGQATDGDDEDTDDEDGDDDGQAGAGDDEGDDEDVDDDDDASGSGGDKSDDDDSDDDDQAGPDDGDDSDKDSDDDNGSSKNDGPSPEELDKQAAEELARALRQLMGHDDEDEDLFRPEEPEDGFKPHAPPPSDDAQDALDKAIRWQKFDAPPGGISDFFEQEPKPGDLLAPSYPPIPFNPALVSGETAHLRTVFTINRKRRLTRSLKKGPKLDVPHLHRIGQDDFRIFGRKDIPDKRDWFVLVGLDDSASTHHNGAAEVIRQMGLAVGEMLNGCGVKFAIFGHGGVGSRNAPGALGVPVGPRWEVRHLVIKGPDEPWTSKCKERLLAMGRDNTCNYDGHSMEQYRKILQRQRATDKMLLYFTDGKMPQMNYIEEEEVLKRELKILRQQRVNLFGVGYATDSPKQHGIDTIVIQGGQDLPGLIHGLRERLEV